MGTQASKLPRRSRSALRVVGGVLGAMAREVVGDRRDGVLCALGQSRSTLHDTDCVRSKEVQGDEEQARRGCTEGGVLCTRPREDEVSRRSVVVLKRGAQRPAGVVVGAGVSRPGSVR